jgi:Holliday junction resolvasome RuvABC endonuclease subunit
MSLLFSKFDNLAHISNLTYVVGLDLSTVSSGIALYNIVEDKIVDVGVIDTSRSEEKVYEQAAGIFKKIEEWIKKYSIETNSLLIAKEKQPIQYGAKTTVSTLISIAKVHGLVENYCYLNKKMLLDIAVPTIRKNVLGNYKADKEEVFAYVIRSFPLFQLDKIKGGKDISDAICVALTGLVALEADYIEQIKELKKSLKNYKSDKKKQEILTCIEFIKRKM